MAQVTSSNEAMKKQERIELQKDPELAQKLISLAHLDIDAVFSYETAMKYTDVEMVHETMKRFKTDHEHHIQDLSVMIRQLGGSPPAHVPDLKGYLLEGFTTVRSATGTLGALKAMRGNEILTNSVYEEALKWQVPAEIRALIEKHKRDEEKHLGYIRDAISDRFWNEGLLAEEAG